MRKRSKIPFLVMSGASLLSLPLSGFATYLYVEGAASVSLGSAGTKKRVCYITGDGGATKTYYTDIGKAISVSRSGETIVVLPRPSNISWEAGREDEDYVIDGTYATDGVLTIPTGVTLSIPYALDGSGNPIANSKKGDMNAPSNAAIEDPGTYCKSTVRFSSVSVSNLGNIEIGGILKSSQANSKGTGRTGGNYSEVLLSDGARIVNGGELWLYGLIDDIPGADEDGSVAAGGLVENLPGSSTNLPMCWHDFGGGSALKGTYNHIDERECLPLDDFYFENIACPVIYHGGSSMTAWVNFRTGAIEVGGIHISDPIAPVYDMKIIDEDSTGILAIPSGSILRSDFDSAIVRHELDFYGDFALNALEIDVEQAVKDNGYGALWGLASQMLPSSVSSAEGYFPISHVWDISLHPDNESGTAFVDGGSGKYKLLNGSSLTIDNGVEFCAGALVVYDGTNYLDNRGTHAKNFYKSGIIANYKEKPAECVVNGSLTAGLVAGELRSTMQDARISASNATSVTMNEPLAGEGSTLTADMTQWFEIPLSLKLLGDDGFVHEFGGEDDIGLYETIALAPTGDGESYYWHRVLEEISSVSIVSAEGFDTPSGQAMSFSLSAQAYPALNQSTITGYEWSVAGEGASLSSRTGQETILSLPQNLDSSEPLSFTVSLRVNANRYDGTPFSLETSQAFRSMPLFDATSVSINPNGGSSSNNAEGNWDLSLTIGPEGYATDITDVVWSVTPSKTDAEYTLTENQDDPTKAHLWVAAVEKGDGDTTYKVTAEVTGESPFGHVFTLTSEEVTFTAKDAGCVLAGTRILVPGGGTLLVEDIKEGDVVLAFDHVTGRMVESQVVLVLREKAVTTVCALRFEDGTVLEIAKEHGLFDLTDGKYAELDSDRPDEYVGHNFLFLDEQGNMARSMLVSVEARREEASFYDVVTARNLNYVANGALSVTRALAPLANTFSFQPDGKYDSVKKEEDIRKYGLSTMEEWAGLLSEKQFVAFNASVTKVGLAKGIYTREYLEELVRAYLSS